jgi:hypothetical protein
MEDYYKNIKMSKKINGHRKKSLFSVDIVVAEIKKYYCLLIL